MTGTESGDSDRSSGVRMVLDAGIDTLPAVLDEVRTTLQLWSSNDRLEDALLAVDELVVNASRHVGGELVVDLVPLETGFRIEVADELPDFRSSVLAPTSERYGLRIVDSVCDRWGVWLDAGSAHGKVVWAEFTTGSAAAPSAAAPPDDVQPL